MNIEEVREYCLAKEGVIEKTPFGKFARRFESILVFYVMGHIFCLTDMDEPDYVEVVSSSGEIDDLKDKYRSASGPGNRAMRNWIRLAYNGDIPDSEILRLIDTAYNLIKAKYSTKQNLSAKRSVNGSR